MTNKLLSITTLLCLIAVLIIGRISPTDPLFYFISIDPTVSGLRFMLVATMVFLAFKSSFKKLYSRNLVAAVGAAFMAFGFASLAVPSISSSINNFLMPLDQLLLVQAGVIYSVAAFDKQIKPIYKESEPAQVPVRVAA